MELYLCLSVLGTLGRGVHAAYTSPRKGILVTISQRSFLWNYFLNSAQAGRVNDGTQWTGKPTRLGGLSSARGFRNNKEKSSLN